MFVTFFGFMNAEVPSKSKGRSGVVVHHNPNTGVLIVMDDENGDLLHGKGRPNIRINVGDDVMFILISKGHPPFIILKDVK